MSDLTGELFAAAQRLQQQGEPYALVSVVRTQAPSSARAGDKALVTAQGIVYGWIGGGCAQPAVLHTVRQALQDGRARLIRVAPADGETSREPPAAAGDRLEFDMSCHSGGTIELFIDPILPPTRLVVIGDSPVAVALAGLAPRVGLPVSVIAIRSASRTRASSSTATSRRWLRDGWLPAAGSWLRLRDVVTCRDCRWRCRSRPRKYGWWRVPARRAHCARRCSPRTATARR